MEMPARGAKVEAVLSDMRRLWKGKPRGTKQDEATLNFKPTGGAEEVAARAFAEYIWVNAFDPTLTPGVLQFETEIVSMVAHLLGGSDETAGNFTSGGTESNLLGVKTARDWARARNPKLTRPQMVLPVTAHPSFRKAAHYLDIEMVITPVDPRTFQADVGKMREAINDRTVLLVGSAPCFSPGVVDPIEEIAALAKKHGIACHVDGCIGAWIMALYRRLGYEVPPFDFGVDGVTSMSVDPHKYGFAPLGSSVVLYRNAEIRKHELYACTNWPGYTLVNPTVQSSRSAGPLAATWALFRHLGQDGYCAIAEGLKKATDRLIGGIESIRDLRILGRPLNPFLAVASDSVDILRVSDELKHRGWMNFPQLSCDNIPKSLHLLIAPCNAGRVDELLADLRASIELVKTTPPQDDLAQLREVIDSVDFTQIDDAGILEILKMVGLGSGEVVGDFAGIYGLLDKLPRDVTDRVVTLYFNELTRYRPDR